MRVKKGAGKPKFSDVFCGPYHTFALTQKGDVYVWGLNNYGQLCTGDNINRYQPELLEEAWLSGRGQVAVAKDLCVASGSHHTVIYCDGDVLTCGRREYGRLGLGKDSEEPKLPTLVTSLKGVKVVAVEAGGACSFVITATGEVYSWGMGTNLQLGMSDEEDVWTPEKVVGKKIENRRTLSLSVGGQHTALLVAIEAD